MRSASFAINVEVRDTYRQATDKIVGISDEAAAFLRVRLTQPLST
jgi:hypothetical protein